MKKIIALAVALCMIISIGIKFNLVSMNSPEDLANQALIKEWQEVNSDITSLEEILAQGDQTVLRHINALKQKRKELQKNSHVQKFMIMMNQAPIRAAIPAPKCMAQLRPGFIDFICAHGSEKLLEQKQVDYAAWSSDNTKLATGFSDGALIWDANTGARIHTLQHNNEVYSVSWNSNNTKIATCSDNDARIWNAQTYLLMHTLTHNAFLNSIVWSPDGTKIVTRSDAARIWNANTGALILTLQINGLIHSVVWSPDGTKLATASGNSASIWNANTGTLIRTFEHQNRVISVAWSPDGTKLATGARDGNAQIWNAHTGILLLTLGHDYQVNSVAWSSDGTKLATRSGYAAKIWNTNTGALLFTLQDINRVSSVAWSPDGTKLATQALNGPTHVWDANTGSLLRILKLNAPTRLVLAWSPDGIKLAIGSATGTTIANLEEYNHLRKLLNALNSDQCDVLRAIDMAIRQNRRIHATIEQWYTFTTLPEKVQHALTRYIKAPAQRSREEREKAFEQRRQTSATTTQ